MPRLARFLDAFIRWMVTLIASLLFWVMFASAWDKHLKQYLWPAPRPSSFSELWQNRVAGPGVRTCGTANCFLTFRKQPFPWNRL